MTVFEVKKVKLYKMGVGWLNAEAKLKEKEVLFPVLLKNQDDFLKTFHVKISGDSLLSSIAFDSEKHDELEIIQHHALSSVLKMLSG